MNFRKTLSSLLMVIATITLSFGQQQQEPFSVKKTGNGPKNLVFIPGFMSSSAVWDETVASLGKDNTCYVFQMAGFAGEPARGEASLNYWKDQIAQYIQREKIEKPIIIGHSLGGLLALELAASYPDLMQSIIVVDAVPSLAAFFNPDFQAAEHPDCAAFAKQFSSISDEQFKAMQTQASKGMADAADKQMLIVDWSMKSDRNFSGLIYCDFNNTDLRKKLAPITVPALILLNGQFAQAKAAVEGQYAELKSKEFQFAPTLTHFIMFDAKDWYLDQIRKAIK